MSFFSRTNLSRNATTLFHFAGFAFADQVLVSGINFLVAIALARLLGVSAFGQFSLVLILVFFCLELQRALITAPMMHWVAKGAQKGYFRRLMQMQLLLAVLLSIGCGAFIWLSGFLFPKWQIQSLALGSGFLIFFRLIQEFMRRYLFIMDKKRDAMLMDAVICGAIVMWLVALYYISALYIETVIIAHMLAYAGASVFLLRTVRSQPAENASPAHGFLNDHWDFGGWLVAAVIVNYASSNLLVMTGGAILGPEATGLVKAAQYMMGGMIVLFQAIENIVPFHMAKLAHRGENTTLYLFALKSTLGMLGFCLLHGLTVLYFIDPLSYWLAPGYSGEIKPLVIGSVILSFLMVVGYNFQYLLRAKNKTRTIFFANAVTAIVSLVIGKPLVTNFGAFGILSGLIAINIIAQVIYAVAFLPGLRKRPA